MLPQGMVRTRKYWGFTLVEVLVVISIVSVLTALMVPALRQSRDQARVVVCSARLRQNTVSGIGFYTSTYKNFLTPIAGLYATSRGNTFIGAPPGTTVNGINVSNTSIMFRSSTGAIGGGYYSVTHHELMTPDRPIPATLVDNEKQLDPGWFCPSDQRGSNLSDPWNLTGWRFPSYQLNSYISFGLSLEASPQAITHTRLDRVRNPSSKVFLAEVHYPTLLGHKPIGVSPRRVPHAAGGWTNVAMIPMPASRNYNMESPARHMRGFNVGFIDGSVRAVNGNPSDTLILNEASVQPEWRAWYRPDTGSTVAQAEEQRLFNVFEP
jgi:prepilin-type N-terminal cleavage/methylation domain-containing protein/prepilin-type processing-associated H-X9-DG protein